MTYNDDPFGSDSRPSVSFADAKVGAVVTGRVIERASLVQSRDFETGEPATWPDGNPKMSAVVALEVDGEERSLWAPKPSSMFAALRDAQKAAGAQFAEGGTLTVKFTREEPNKKNPKLHAQKIYEAKYEPPSAFNDGAPF